MGVISAAASGSTPWRSANIGRLAAPGKTPDSKKPVRERQARKPRYFSGTILSRSRIHGSCAGEHGGGVPHGYGDVIG